jgi:hypothetical protein
VEKSSPIKRIFTKNDYKIVLYITADPSLLPQITQVTYILHHTFEQPVVKATDSANNYKYTIFVWGEFLLRAEVSLKDGSVIDLAKNLKFNGILKDDLMNE